jgi:hypothetical protein
MMKPERVAQILAAVCLVIIALLVGRPSFTNASEPVRGITDPWIALQMARNVQEVDAILGEAPSPDREVMRMKQYVDFAFIATYLAIALVMSWALRRRMKMAAIALAVCVAAVAVFDLLENLAILRLLPVGLEDTTQAMINAIRAPSTLKWSLVSLAMVLVAIFYLDARRWYLRLLGLLDLAAGALTCWGMFHNAWLPWAGAALFIALLASAATLKFLTHESAT